MPEKRMQSLPLLRRTVRRNKSGGGLRDAEPIEDSEEPDDRHAKRVDTERVRTKDTGDVNLEQISGARGKQSPGEKNGGMARDLPDVTAKFCLMIWQSVERWSRIDRIGNA